MAINLPSAPGVPLPLPETLLTYEAYMAEGHVEGRYDIIDGVRMPMPGATWPHQKTVFKINTILDRYATTTGNGEALAAPFDVLIRRVPRLRTRQPDVLFITHSQLATGGGIPEKGPLEVAPELVVEVISESETQNELDDKLTDYIAIGVLEAWIVRREARTVEVLHLTPGGPLPLTVYQQADTLQSAVFPDLTVPVAELFAP